jgi:hypothetical protein
MVAVAAPPRVAARLRAAPDGPVPVLHRGPDAVYVSVSGACVGVVGSRATAVPCALRLGAAVVPSAAAASVVGGVLHLDGSPLVVGRYVDVSVPRLSARASRLSLTPAEVASMIGRGDGLTPYGDDVVCGWLAVHRAAGIATPEVDAALVDPPTTLLSATLLDCASHGEVIPEFAAWLAARDERSAAVLERVGHSSGRGLLEGARRALSDLDMMGP